MCGKMQASGLTEIIPFLCISATWGQHPASWFFTDAGLQALFSLLGPSWHQASHLEALNNWWLWHACLLIWQEILFYSYKVFLKKHLKLEGKKKKNQTFKNNPDKVSRLSEQVFDRLPQKCTMVHFHQAMAAARPESEQALYQRKVSLCDSIEKTCWIEIQHLDLNSLNSFCLIFLHTLKLTNLISD